jgi:hypothetical protein
MILIFFFLLGCWSEPESQSPVVSLSIPSSEEEGVGLWELKCISSGEPDDDEVEVEGPVARAEETPPVKPPPLPPPLVLNQDEAPDELEELHEDEIMPGMEKSERGSLDLILFLKILKSI